MITTKKQAFCKEKLSETISKPKEIWESLKSLGMPNKTGISNFNAIEEGNTLTHDTRSISKIFKNFFSNLVLQLQNLVLYYSSFAITADFCLVDTIEK